MLTASGDQTARLWDIATGQNFRVLPGHEGRVFAGVFSPDGERVLTASRDDTAGETWSTVQALVAEARRRMPRQLTPGQEKRCGLRSTSAGN